MSRINKYLILLPILLAGCRSTSDINIPFIPGLGPHKIDIQQGNVITQDMLEKLQPGMTRSQVRFVLGTPLLVDPFRTDRWDYLYSLDKKGGRVEQRQLKVYFKDDKMVRYEGDIPVDAKPGEKPAATAAKPDIKPEVKPAPVQPAAAPPAKPEPPAPAVATPAPAPATPAREAATLDDAKPQLRMAPNEGEPVKPEEQAPAAAQSAPAAAQPATTEPLEAPPLPRLVLPPETDEKPAPSATTPDTPAK